MPLQASRPLPPHPAIFHDISAAPGSSDEAKTSSALFIRSHLLEMMTEYKSESLGAGLCGRDRVGGRQPRQNLGYGVDCMAGLRRSFALSFLDKYITLFLSIGTIAVLARILTPADTGVYSVAAGLVNVAQTLREFGAGNYVLQETELSKEKLATALGMSVLSGILLALIFALTSGEIARWFHEPKVKTVVLVISLNFMIVGFSSISWVQLQRKMNFGAMTRISIAAAIGRSVVGIFLASRGYGAVAMAWSSVAGNVVSFVGTFVALGREGLVFPRLVEWRALMSFGAASAGASLLQMITSNVPDVIVGRMLGFSQAGLLSRARSLTTLFESSFMGGIRPVATSSLAQANRGGGAMADLYLRFFDHTIMIAWPLLLLMAIFAKPIVFIAFGNQWVSAVPASRLFCLAAAITLISDLACLAMIAVGAMRSNLVAYAIATPVHVVLIIIACNSGIEGAAAAICVSMLLLALVAQGGANKILGLKWGQVVATLSRAVAAVGVTAIVPIIFVTMRQDDGIPMYLTTLLVGGLSGVLSWLIFIFLSRHPLWDEIKTIFRNVMGLF
ncbi:MAG: lipopolysaccharide biosynthesis protein [Rhodospirillaceae bacterium]|nr:MAG: lipopolysaccharide biosynthesis protein [Rhodospirillaceae bacterium]